MPPGGGMQLRQAIQASPRVAQLRAMQSSANASSQVTHLKANQDCIGGACPAPVATSVDYDISPQDTGGAPMQRAVADVDYTVGNGGNQHHAGQHVGVGDNAVGGVNHSEQLSWNAVSNTVLQGIQNGHQVTVKFTIDMTVCGGCTAWFENTVWTQMNAAIGNGNGGFTLEVEVGNNTVPVNGNNTIWPNEISDAPTWNRLNAYEMMDRFIRENRDEDGDVMNAGYDNHITGLRGEFDDVIGNGIIDGQDIIACFNQGLVDACRLQVAAYNFRDQNDNEDPAAMRNHIRGQDDVSLFHAVTSAWINAIPAWNVATDFANNGEAWKRRMTAVFKGWFETYIDLNLDDHRIQAECPHY